MSDNDTLPPEIDDEIRARLRTFAEEVTEHADTEAALGRVPNGSRSSTTRLLAIAACLLAVVALAAALAADREEVETIGPAESPTQTTECPEPITPRGVTQGAQMNKRFAAPAASAATAILLLGACSDDDDGPRTLARGDDVELVGDDALGDQTLNISVEEEDGEVSGEFRISEVVVRVECADTDIDGFVILGGEVTTGEEGEDALEGDMLALIIREGDPDSVHLKGNDDGAGSCTELVESISEDLLRGSDFVDVEAGSDIETG